MLYEVITVKLLRFLEDGKVTRLGGTKPKQVDVRILAATHGDLEEMVEQKEFRLDLYYRLNVIPLVITSYSIHYTKLYEFYGALPYCRPEIRNIRSG